MGRKLLPEGFAALVKIAEDHGYNFTMMRGVIDVNDEQLGADGRPRSAPARWPARCAISAGVTVGALGLTFKAGTDDLRESPALAIITELRRRGAGWSHSIRRLSGAVTPHQAPCSTGSTSRRSAVVADPADVIAVFTEWPEFAKIDLPPSLAAVDGLAIVDTRNLFDPVLVREGRVRVRRRRSPLMRVLVAGGAGFLGSHLCDALIHRGDEVVCVDNFVTVVPNIDHLIGPRSSRSSTTTWSDLDVDVLGGLDAVMNLASPASPKADLAIPLEILDVGSTGTRELLEVARHHGARFFLASTSEVYGDPLVYPQPETYWGHVNPIGVRSVYDEAKRFSEALTVAYRRARGLDMRIVRIFNTYGPRMQSTTAGSCRTSSSRRSAASR